MDSITFRVTTTTGYVKIWVGNDKYRFPTRVEEGAHYVDIPIALYKRLEVDIELKFLQGVLEECGVERCHARYHAEKLEPPAVVEPGPIEGLDPDPEVPSVYEADEHGKPILYSRIAHHPRYTREELEADPALVPNVHDVDDEGVPIVYRP